MSGIVNPPKIFVQTLEVNRYTYFLNNLIPHVSVNYAIDCFNDNVFVKSITGILEGEQYKEWTNDEWLDRFIKSKVEDLPEPIIEPLEDLEPLEEEVKEEEEEEIKEEESI